MRNLGGFNFQALGAPWDLTQIGQALGVQALALNHAGGLDVTMRAQTSIGPVHRIQMNGDGHGSFAFENVLAFPAYVGGWDSMSPDAIQIADMDGDGRLDIVANTNGATRGHRGVFLNRASHVQLGDDHIFQAGFQ